jgi:hypothetical protein
MKKIIMFSTYILLIASGCGNDKLPSNIASILVTEQANLDELNRVDSLIISLNDEEIKKISKDSCFSLYSSHNNFQEWYDESSEELMEILKINPIYSDYTEIKNRKYEYVIEKTLRWEEGPKLLIDNLDKLKERGLSY